MFAEKDYLKLNSPPRKISLSVKAYFMSMGMCITAAVVLLYAVVIFFCNNDASPYKELHFIIDKKELAEGRVNSAELFLKAVLSRTYSKSFHFIVKYSFIARSGKIYSGYSYYRSKKSILKYDKGQSVQIEYLSDNPGISRLKGLAYSRSKSALYLIIVIFFAALLPVFFIFLYNMNSIKYLKYGVISQAKVINVKICRKKSSRNKKYYYHYEAGCVFKTDGGGDINALFAGVEEVSKRNSIPSEGEILYALYMPDISVKYVFIRDYTDKLAVNDIGDFTVLRSAAGVIIFFVSLSAMIISVSLLIVQSIIHFLSL